MGMVRMVSMMRVTMVTLFPCIKINFWDCNSITGYQWVDGRRIPKCERLHESNFVTIITMN